MQATRIANPSALRLVETAAAKPERMLPVAGLFGANATGKSALLRTMADMRALVLGSFKDPGIHRQSFLLDASSQEASSEFMVDLILDGVWWQYGFEFDDERILREFARHYPRGRQALVFERTPETLAFGPTFRALGRALRPLLRNNALLLSIVGAVDQNAVSPLFEWWQANMHLAWSANRQQRHTETAELAKADAARQRILQMLRAADLGVTDIKLVEETDTEMLTKLRRVTRIMLEGDLTPGEEAALDKVKPVKVQLAHGGDGAMLDAVDESMGTLVWLGLTGPVLEALDRGTVLLVDELDASLHPLLVNRLVELFQNPRTNPRGAQLIFNSHDTTLLEGNQPFALGRDQLWFTERGADGVSRLAPLADFSARRGESVRRRYLGGRYGGVPNMDPVAFERATDVQAPV